MPGERTVVRIFLDAQNNVNYDTLIDRDLDDKTVSAVIGTLQIISGKIAAMFNEEILPPNEVDDIRGLLDIGEQGD